MLKFHWRWGTFRRAAVSRARFRPQVDALEDRSVPSNLVWTNRGEADDRFTEVFGGRAEDARRVVDYCLASWGKVIVNLNQPEVDASPDKNTITFTVRMDTEAGFGGSAAATKYAFPTEEDRDNNRNGYPTAGEIILRAGRDGRPDRGWWIDPNPGDFTPFTNVISPFAATREPGSPGVDLVDIINGEIAHVLGLFSSPARLQTPLTGTISKVTPPVEDRHDSSGKSVAGFYYVFDGPSITQLLTSYDSGGGDTGSAIHTPQPKDTNLPITFESKFNGTISLTGALDAGNAEGGSRVIPSDNLMKLFKDAYGYDVLMPSTLPGATFNTSVTPTGRLVIRGGPDGDPAPIGDTPPGDGGDGGDGDGNGHGLGAPYHDTGPASPDRIVLRRDGDDLVITITPGRAGAVENANPNAVGNGRPVVIRVPLASFTGIDLQAGGDDDAIIFDLSGGDFLPGGGFNLDGQDGADGVSVVGGASQLTDGGRTLTVPGMGSVSLLSTVGPDPELRGTGDTAMAFGGTVRVVAPDGTTRLNLTPLGGAGVRAAVADFTGDGVADIVAGSGPGRATQVRVLDGATQQELFTIDPFEATFTGGVFVAVGDLTGDGVPDLVVTPDEGGGPRARVFSGAGFKQIADFLGIDDPAFRGGARAAVGDVTGDGVGDLLVAAGFGGGPRVAVFDGTSLSDGAFTRKPFPDFFAFEPALRNGVYVAAGDLTGDGLADLVTGAGPGGAPRMSVFDGDGLLDGRQTRTTDFFAGDTASRTGVRVAVKDLDGDGRADLVTAGPGGTSRFLGEDLTAGRTTGMAFGGFGEDAGGVFVG